MESPSIIFTLAMIIIVIDERRFKSNCKPNKTYVIDDVNKVSEKSVRNRDDQYAFGKQRLFIHSFTHSLTYSLSRSLARLFVIYCSNLSFRI